MSLLAFWPSGGLFLAFRLPFFGLQVAFFGVGLACLISMAYAIRLPAMFELAFLTCRLHVSRRPRRFDSVGLACLISMAYAIHLPAMFDLAFLTCRLHVHVGLAGLTDR